MNGRALRSGCSREREPSAFSLGCLSTCNGCDVYSKSVRSVSTSRCIYLLPSVRMSKSVLNSIPKIENRPSVVRSSLSRRNRLHWRPRARDPTRARQRTRVDPRGRASRPRSESAHTRATGTRARTHADRLPPSPARACRSDAAGALKCRVVFETCPPRRPPPRTRRRPGTRRSTSPTRHSRRRPSRTRRYVPTHAHSRHDLHARIAPNFILRGEETRGPTRVHPRPTSRPTHPTPT